ncbi:complement factor H-like isoform X2 [Sardina pilchardus]|uniref:complement factor H-like isoform X2 n=1 Tax=Sardina pilchardus TaxID=27697 RepID=UPI002E16880E
MQAVFLPFVLFMCLCSLGKCERDCEKSSIERERPANVDLSSLDPSYEDGKAVRLRCEPGYTGLQRASCRDGKWTVTGRRCQKKPCGHPGDTPNGDFELAGGDDFVFGAVVQYICKTGYRMMSRNSQRSCVASGWDNDIPVCQEVKCPIIQVAGNVQASGNVEDGGYGDVIHFECQSPDLQLNGLGEIHCTDEGKWSGDIPTCKEIECEEPPISNGRVTNTQPVFKKDDILRYTCDERYQASDGPNPKCTKFGWTSTPECKEIRCSLENASPGTTRIPDQSFFRPGDNVEIVCLDGYRTPTFKQRDSFLCGEDGKWPIRKTPDCEKIYCARPREWNVVRDFDSSRKYPYDSYDYKETARYTCTWRYKATQTENTGVATCGLEGWTPKPLCVDKDACTSPTIENGFIVHLTKNTVVFSCNNGFKQNTGGWWKKIQCSTGSWSPIPKCIDQNECTSPPDAENAEYHGYIKDIYSNGDSRLFRCDPGYMSEVQEIKCVDGEWEKPNCRRNGNWCTAPPDLENAIIDSSYQEWYINEFKVKYTCRQPYKIDGEDTITCKSGNWTDRPICIPACAAPTDADNVRYMANNKTFYRDEDFLEFECKPGYRSDLQQIKCQNTAWGDPNCKRDYELCTTPPAIENGKIVNQEPHPKYPNTFVTVEYACNDDNHQMRGHHTITCNQGSWTYPPSCIKSSRCDLPPAESFIATTDHQDHQVIFHGTWVTFQCPPFYNFADSKDLKKELKNVCENGNWRHPMRCWKPCIVRPEDMVNKNINFKIIIEGLRYVGHKDHVTFVCQSGIPKNEKDMRQMCYDGNIKLPECH